MNATRTAITAQVVAPSSQPSIRDQTTSSIRPEAPERANRAAIPGAVSDPRGGRRRPRDSIAVAVAAVGSETRSDMEAVESHQSLVDHDYRGASSRGQG